jgi:photosystem II stability/assembly factor-like uncharacterized protein
MKLRTQHSVLLAAAAAGMVAVAAAEVVLDPNDQANKPAEVLPLAPRSLLLDVALAGARFVAVGDRGNVLLSDDQGATWRQAKSVPTRNMLTAVYFANADRGWAVGHDETILNSTDGGETWTRSHFAPESQQPLLDVWFADADRGIAVGAYGAYFTTVDGGKTWTSTKFAAVDPAAAKPAALATGDGTADAENFDEELPPDFHLNRIAAAGDKLYIGAEAGNLYMSADGGTTWTKMPSPYDGSFYGLLPLDGNRLLAFGLRGNLWRTDDGGANWSQVQTGTVAMLTDGVRKSDGTLVIGGLSGAVLVSRDNGATWQAQNQADRKGISALLPTGGANVLTVGEAGVKTIALNAG